MEIRLNDEVCVELTVPSVFLNMNLETPFPPPSLCHSGLWHTPGTADQTELEFSFNPSSFDGLPGGSDGKESACNDRDLGSILVLGRCPGGGHGNPLQYSCLENPHGQRSLAGSSPWDHKK